MTIELDTDFIAAAVRDALSEAKTDFSSLEGTVIEVLRAFLGELRQELPREAESLTQSEALDELADRVAIALSDQLPVPASRLPETASAGFVAQAALIAASDHLQIQLESFNDRVRAGSRALESLADELNSRERTAAAANDQLARSVETSVARLSHRVETRLDEVTRSDGSGALAGEVRDLADKLRQLMNRLDTIQQGMRS